MAKGAEAAPVVLNRREVVNQGAGLGLEDPATGGLHPVSGVNTTGATEIHEEVIDVEDEEMGVTPQATNDVVDPTLAELTTMEVDESRHLLTLLRPPRHLGSRPRRTQGKQSGTLLSRAPR